MSADRNADRRYGGPWIAVLFAVIFAVLCAVFASSFAPAQPVNDDAKSATVTIDNFSFSPDVLTIKTGTKVTFVNHDDIPHSVVAVDKSFRSKVLDADDSYAFTFNTPGDFNYFCSLHPHMTGKIVVAP
jgi:plastocyanin